ncbi:MAG: TetR/AcrR family transcriptional regulator [Clostridia bacterium]|nr:TetR/AcrR family transcriptional regulator [Clostridia bacterium]
MSPRARITREMILDAALSVIEREGHEALTVRRLATELDCSTQPIVYHFGSVAQIVEEVYRRADAFHTAYLTDGLEDEEEPLLALGLRYIRFGAEKSGLFRFLFQSGRFSRRTPEELTADAEVAPLIGIVRASSGLSPQEAGDIFRGLFVAVHGYASLLANNAMRWDPEAAAGLLKALYEGLTKQGGQEK